MRRKSSSSRTPKHTSATHGTKKTLKKALKLTSAKSLKPAKKITHHSFKVNKITLPEPAGTEKIAFSKSPTHILYKIRHVVGWTFVALLVMGVLSIVASGEKAAQSSRLTHMAPKASIFDAFGDHEVTLIAVGDILPARFVEQSMRKAKDYTLPFKEATAFLQNADITFGNLESPVFPGRTTKTNSMTFRADAESIGGIRDAGFDLLTCANNHTMNYKAPGLQRTLDAFRAMGLSYAGCGENLAAARKPAIVKVGAKRVAFLAYNDKKIAPGFHGEATEHLAGIAPADMEGVKVDVKEARRQADIVVVSLHAGVEYRKEPKQFQKDFAHAAIDAGADLVVGHHSHIVQPVEKYGNGLILYSLGNFVFDQFFSEDVRTGLVAKITFPPGQAPTAEFFPSVVDKDNDITPRITEGQERMQVLGKLGLPAGL